MSALNGDHVFHVNHPAWREGRNDPRTAVGRSSRSACAIVTGRWTSSIRRIRARIQIQKSCTVAGTSERLEHEC